MDKKSDYNKSFWSKMEDIDEVKVNNGVDKFKMKEKGEKARIAFPLINPKTGKVAVKAVKVFKFNAKDNWANFQAPEDENSKAYKTAVAYAGDPQIVYVTPVLVYSTNQNGKVISNDEYYITNLTLPNQRLQKLKSIQDQYGLSENDIIVECDEPKYQNLSFMSVPGSGLHSGFINQKSRDGSVKKMEMELDRDKILEEAIEKMEEADLAIGNRWSEEQILAFFKKVESSEDDEEYDDDDYEDEQPVKKKETSKGSKSSKKEFYDEDEDYSEFDEE